MAGTETAFERTFADIAFATIQDAMPSAIQDLLGFQILDSNDSQTYGVGVFGFNFNDQLAYVPVFYLNGQLKGYNLLYLPKKDLFLPANEEYIEYIKNRENIDIGEQTTAEEDKRKPSTPDYDRITGSTSRNTSSYSTKFAFTHGVVNKRGAVRFRVYNKKITAPWYKPIKSAAEERYSEWRQRIDLNNIIKQAGAPVAVAIHNAAGRVEGIRRGLRRFYPSLISDLRKQATVEDNPWAICTKTVGRKDPDKYERCVLQVKAKNKKRKQPKGMPKLAVYNRMPEYNVNGLTQSQLTSVIKGERVILDFRKQSEVTRVVDYSAPRSFDGLYKPGIFKLLLGNGELRDSVVALPVNINVGILSAPVLHDNNGDGIGDRTYFVWFFNGDGHASVGSNKLLATKSDKGYEDIGKALKPGNVSVDDRIIIITPEYQSIGPLRVTETINKDGRFVIGVNDEIYDDSGYASPSSIRRNSTMGHIHVDNRDSGPVRSVDKQIFVPDNSRVIVLSRENWANDIYNVGNNFGTIDTVLRLAMRDNPAVVSAEIKKSDYGEHYTILTRRQNVPLTKSANYRDAYEYLILRHGLNKADAEELLNIDKGETKRAVFLYPGDEPCIKYAINPTDSIRAPAFKDVQQRINSIFGVPEEHTEYRNEPVESLEPDEPTDDMVPELGGDMFNDDAAVFDEESKAQTKEVFDTKMLGALLKSTRSAEMIEQYLGDLMLGLDRIGRLLFLFFEHYDEFSDRYGDNEMLELEENLSSILNTMGELILFLRRKDLSRAVNIFNKQR